MVLLHGQGMGRGGDERMLKARWLHDELGVNVALPVLPLHGPRAEGLAPHEQFVSGLFLQNNVFGLAQAVSDVRRLIGWLRTSREAPEVGVLGVSLGSMVCSLLATTDADLACAIPVVPTVDLAGALRRSEPAIGSRARMHRQLHDSRTDLVLGQVSPIQRKCLVAHDRRLIVAGQVDHVAAPADAAALWRAWDKPRIEWLPGGHLTTFTSRRYRDMIGGYLRS
jgi:hypothetical protein